MWYMHLQYVWCMFVDIQVLTIVACNSSHNLGHLYFSMQSNNKEAITLNQQIKSSEVVEVLRIFVNLEGHKIFWKNSNHRIFQYLHKLLTLNKTSPKAYMLFMKLVLMSKSFKRIICFRLFIVDGFGPKAMIHSQMKKIMLMHWNLSTMNDIPGSNTVFPFKEIKKVNIAKEYQVTSRVSIVRED